MGRLLRNPAAATSPKIFGLSTHKQTRAISTARVIDEVQIESQRADRIKRAMFRKEFFGSCFRSKLIAACNRSGRISAQVIVQIDLFLLQNTHHL
jgi:hypothetical protein